MANPNQNQFNSTNPFANNNKKNHHIRRGSISKAPPKAPSSAPPRPNAGSMAEQKLRQQLYQSQNMYKQTKNQLEVLKAQFRGQEKELNTFKSQKHLIDSNHQNIVSWQKRIADLELEKQTLIDKNGLFLQQKNTILLQLADQQEKCNELKVEIESKTVEIEKLENKITNSSQNYTQQLSKKDNKYKNLKNEYNGLNKEYIEKKKKNKEITEELNEMALQFKEMKQENLLLKDKYDKLQNEYNTLKIDHQQIRTQISEVKGDATIAVQLAQKKDKNIIKDLRQTLKTETMKLQSLRAEYMQLKDELNDLRDWRENYLRQQKLQQTQIQTTNNMNNTETSPEIEETKINVDNLDNTSTTSSTSNHTSSSKTSKNSKSSKSSNRNQITMKNKLKIIKKKSVTAISNVSLPSFQGLLSNEFGTDDEKIQTNPMYSNNVSNPIQPIISTREHDEVIQALSDRLAIVKENYMNLKHVVSNKNTEIEKLNFELEKKKEMVADLIEKLIDKPLPPTPTQLAKLEQAENEYKGAQIQSDEDKVLMNLEQQGLSAPIINRKHIVKHIGNSQQLLYNHNNHDNHNNHNRPPIPSHAPPISPNNNNNNHNTSNMEMSAMRSKRSPPSVPPPKVVTSPTYNKQIGHNSHFPYDANAAHNNDNQQILNNQLNKAKENKYIDYNSKPYRLNQDSIDEIKPLVTNHDDDDDEDDVMNTDGI